MQMLFSLTLDTFHGQLQKKKKKEKTYLKYYIFLLFVIL